MVSLTHRTHRPDPDQCFDEISRILGRFWERRQGPLLEGKYCPPLEVVESDESIVVKIRLSGMRSNDIELSVECSSLTISGERQESSDEKGGGDCHRQCRYGRFHHIVTLPSEVDTGKVSIEFGNGVLTVTLARVDGTHRKWIEVTPK